MLKGIQGDESRQVGENEDVVCGDWAMRLPLPSVMDWLKTLWLVVLILFWAIVAIKPMEWIDGAFRITQDSLVYVPGFLLFGVIFPLVSTAVIHHVLWGKRSLVFPIWVPSRVSWGEALWCYWAAVCFFIYILVLILAIFLLFGLVLLGLKQVLPPDVVDSIAVTAMKVIQAPVESWRQIDSSTSSSEQFPFITLISWAVWAYCAALTFRAQRLRAASKLRQNAEENHL